MSMNTVFAAAILATIAMASERADLTQAYIALVDQYRLGDRKSAVDHLATWADEDLTRALRGLQDALWPRTDATGRRPLGPDAPVSLQPDERKKPTPLEWFATAMIFHADVARTDRSILDRHLNAAEQLFGLVADLERHGHRLTQLPPDARERTRFTGLWHALAAAIALASSAIPRAATHFELAQRFGNDEPTVLIGAGSFHERLAGLVGPDPQRRDFTFAGPYGRMSAEAHLQRAAACFERVLALNPATWEARMRLGRVSWQLGQTERARHEIAQALESAPSPSAEYLTRMIAGAIAEQGGHMNDALLHYRRAHSLCGDCQSVAVALSHALARTGARAAAVQVIERMLDVPSVLRSDPWWGYHMGQLQLLDELLEQLRSVVPR
jgi:tetratricopeptide (TPR) repeat protein